MFSQVIPCKQGVGVEGAHLECSKCRDAPRPNPACRHSKNMFITYPTSPAGPPVDVGMRIDVASIDMVSEVNMVSGLQTGPAAGLTQMRNGQVPVPSAFRWRSSRPGAGRPTPRALPTLAHTHCCPWFVFYTHTHTGNVTDSFLVAISTRCISGVFSRHIGGRSR